MTLAVKIKHTGVILAASVMLLNFTSCHPRSTSSEDSGTASSASDPYTSDGFVTAESLGAYPNDEEDDYPVISQALAKGKNIWFDSGTYEFSRKLTIKDQTLSGGGMMITTLQYSADDKGTLLKAEGVCNLYDLTLSVKEALLTGKEKQGDYVLLWCGNKAALSKGSKIQNVCFNLCGTAVYAPADQRAAVSGTVFDTLEIQRFTYRGIDLRSPERAGNEFSNVYIVHGYLGETETNADAAFVLEGQDTGTVIDQLNVEHMKASRPIILSGCRDLKATAIHIEGITVGQSDSGFMNVENTSGEIDALTVFYAPVDYDRVSVVRFGDAEKSNALGISVLHLKGMNDPNAALHGARSGGLLSGHGTSFKMMNRAESAKGEYTVGIDSYVFFSYQNDRAVYDRFDTAGDLTFTSIGVLPPAGTMAQRPATRLCKGYTTYFDTTLGKTIVWNGTAWE